MFHKEGYSIIAIAVVVFTAGLLTADAYITIPWLKYTIFTVLIALLLLILQFFRNPSRLPVLHNDHVLAPVDGKVVVIEEVFEKEFFNEKRLQISIFMSPINVHITRYPVSGTVIYSNYHPGKYLVAWHPKASEENERTTVVVNTESFGNILYRQIAGAMAKRIVNYAKKGEIVRQGDDSGFIKFGSRVDVFLPVDTKLNITLNQKVKGAISVIASK